MIIFSMLNADDLYTPASLHRLKEVIRRRRPLVLWIGAGASRWAGLPSWHDSARRMCRAFAKTTPAFPEDFAKALISSRNYPEFFQMCRDTDSSLYNRTLLQQFSSPAIEPLYEQFVRRLKGISPIQIITTNVDLCLEQHLGVIDVIEKTDLERCEECIQAGVAFIGKLHGSISAIQSLVFTSADYKDLSQNSEYLAAVKSIFSVASVIFLGYGLQDEYVLKLIAKNETEHELYGSGPHFLVTSSPAPSENGVHRISYRIIQHADHRAALTVLDVISQTRATPLVESVPASQKNIEGTYKESGFYISDFRPSGTHISGQTVDLQKMENNGMKIRALLGLGFSQTELPNSETVAFHDFAVGLVCFDRVFLPLQLIGVLHQAIPGVFWQVIDSQAIKFVDIIHAPFFVSEPDNLMGDIGIFRDQLAQETETRSAMSVIRKILKPAPGMEEEGERRIETLGTHVVSFSDSERLGLPSMVRDALLLPRVSQLLGYSDYIGPNTIPRWLAYPTLRLAHLVQTALICDQLQIRASRVPFGGVSLLSAAFSVKPAEQSVYEYASFVLAGTYGSNLSTYIERNPHSLLSILKFRESTEGEALRREVSDRLETNEGTEFSAAIEGSLKRGIPAAIIQAARDKFSTLMTTANRNASATALWANSNTDDRSLRLWRERSKELLRIEAKAIGVKSDSLCLCGSGDRFRDCCLRPLN